MEILPQVTFLIIWIILADLVAPAVIPVVNLLVH
jgi:hypothetical protein